MNINSIQDLAAASGIEPGIIASLAFSHSKRYRTFQIPKKSGGSRAISAPYPALLRVQRAIARYMLSTIPIHPSAVGYRKNHSIKHHAEPHLASRDFAKFDLEDCFGSITDRLVNDIFRKWIDSDEFRFIVTSLVTDNGTLPQGAATSPYICNIALTELDEAMQAVCAKKKLIYTRYADDILVSGNKISVPMYNELFSVISECGLKANFKSKLMRNPSKIIICGMSLSSGEIKLPRTTKRQIRKSAHFLITNHITLKEFDNSPFTDATFDPLYADRILGQLGFWRFLEPSADFPLRYIKKISSLLEQMESESQSL